MTRGGWQIPSLYHLYTDGSASHLSGEGGWAFILLSEQGLEDEGSGHKNPATNNSMELYAVIKGLEAIKKPSTIRVYSDSAYVVNTMVNKWWEEWQINGWKKRGGTPTPNSSLWERLVKLVDFHKEVEFVKVKGHSGDPLNDRCDRMAKDARKLGQPKWQLPVNQDMTIK